MTYMIYASREMVCTFPDPPSAHHRFKDLELSVKAIYRKYMGCFGNICFVQNQNLSQVKNMKLAFQEGSGLLPCHFT